MHPKQNLQLRHLLIQFYHIFPVLDQMNPVEGRKEKVDCFFGYCRPNQLPEVVVGEWGTWLVRIQHNEWINQWMTLQGGYRAERAAKNCRMFPISAINNSYNRWEETAILSFLDGFYCLEYSVTKLISGHLQDRNASSYRWQLWYDIDDDFADIDDDNADIDDDQRKQWSRCLWCIALYYPT